MVQGSHGHPSLRGNQVDLSVRLDPVLLSVLIHLDHGSEKYETIRHIDLYSYIILNKSNIRVSKLLYNLENFKQAILHNVFWTSTQIHFEFCAEVLILKL